MQILPALITSAFGAGIALALGVSLTSATAPLAVAALLAGASIVAWFRGAPTGLLGCAIAGIAAAGAALGADAEARARSPALAATIESAAGAVVTMRGVLTEDASLGPNGVRIRLAVQAANGEPHDGVEIAALTIGGELAPPRMGQWTAGRILELPATLRRPAHYLNPGVPDDRLALARRALVGVGSVKSATLVHVASAGTWRQELAARLRDRVRRALQAHVAPSSADAAAIATAILIGDRAGLDPALEDRLQAAGTYHVIAISGGNIAVLTAVLLGVARTLRLTHRLGYLAVACLLVAHADLVGGGPSVLRATTMAVAYLALRCVDQSAWSLNALAAAAAALLLVSPLAVVEPGFLLSVGATAAIIVLSGRLASIVESGRFWRLVAGVLGASLATEIVLLPISATLFNRVTMAGLILNLGAVPLMAVVQIAGSVTVFADAVLPSLATATGIAASLAAEGLVASSKLVDWWPWLAVRVPAPHMAVTTLYLAAVTMLVTAPVLSGISSRRHVVRAATAVVVVAACWILSAPTTWPWPWRADGLLRVIALDVGQADATLVEFPDGTRWLVDAGGLPGSTSFDVGARVVAPALWTRGIGRLDVLVLTHGDPDHIGGARSVVDDFRPDVRGGIDVPSHAPMAALRSHAAARGRRWMSVASGEGWTVGGVDVRVWHPERPDWERQRVRNDDSVVLELRYRDVSVILPGDISADVERVLATRIPPARSRVLKLAHHGSATSTSAEWLEGLRPQMAILSCGRENRYGHPAPAVMARLTERGIEVRRTDREGMVVVETDGTSLNRASWSQSRRREGHEGAKDAGGSNDHDLDAIQRR